MAIALYNNEYRCILSLHFGFFLNLHQSSSENTLSVVVSFWENIIQYEARVVSLLINNCTIGHFSYKNLWNEKKQSNMQSIFCWQVLVPNIFFFLNMHREATRLLRRPIDLEIHSIEYVRFHIICEIPNNNLHLFHPA